MKQNNRKKAKLQQKFPLGSLISLWDWDLTGAVYDGFKKVKEFGIVCGYAPDNIEYPGAFIEPWLYIWKAGLLEKIRASRCTSLQRPYKKIKEL